MNRKILIALAFATLASPTYAMQKCTNAKGHVTFTDAEHCPPGTRGDYYQPPEVTTAHGGGLRPGERQLLEQARQQDARDYQAKRQAWQRDEQNRLSFSDRKRLRELQMERRQLSKSLQRGSKSWAEKMAISSQIRDIDRQIEKLQ
jgi:hypothetical protein